MTECSCIAYGALALHKSRQSQLQWYTLAILTLRSKGRRIKSLRSSLATKRAQVQPDPHEVLSQTNKQTNKNHIDAVPDILLWLGQVFLPLSIPKNLYMSNKGKTVGA